MNNNIMDIISKVETLYKIDSFSSLVTREELLYYCQTKGFDCKRTLNKQHLLSLTESLINGETPNEEFSRKPLGRPTTSPQRPGSGRRPSPSKIDITDDYVESFLAGDGDDRNITKDIIRVYLDKNDIPIKAGASRVEMINLAREIAKGNVPDGPALGRGKVGRPSKKPQVSSLEKRIVKSDPTLTTDELYDFLTQKGAVANEIQEEYLLLAARLTLDPNLLNRKFLVDFIQTHKNRRFVEKFEKVHDLKVEALDLLQLEMADS